MKTADLRSFLDEKVETYNQPSFIADDPIAVPHEYQQKQDIEMAGFIAAVFAWGQRKTIISKAKSFLQLMDNDPHNFILHSTDSDLKPFLSFKHRTFNATDALYFIHFFKWFYKNHESLEEAFIGREAGMEARLIQFHDTFFSLSDYPERTRKHIATPARKSACKRINMFLRWMVRKDDQGVDFGLWSRIQSGELICPCDLHVDRVARRLGLIKRKQTDWLTAVELTNSLKVLDPNDPVKYDFALFGLGIMEKF